MYIAKTVHITYVQSGIYSVILWIQSSSKGSFQMLLTTL